MSKKSPRIAALLAEVAGSGPWDPHYLGYFRCFNAGQYYEAHDVLEELWLSDRNGMNGDFYKGLIQLAGAFVHLQKNREHPLHRTHRARLAPAARLFRLAATNLEKYPPQHESLDLAGVRALCADLILRLERGGFAENPWRPEGAPHLELLS